MENTITPTPHLSRAKLQQYQQLSRLLGGVVRMAKTEIHMNKLKNGGGSEKTAECFRYVGGLRKKEEAALKTLENYLKEDAANHPSHDHSNDLEHLSQELKKYKTSGGGW